MIFLNRSNDYLLFTSMADYLKHLGIAFQDPVLIEKYYSSLRGIFLIGVKNQRDNQGRYLDIDALPKSPIDFKKIFIQWMIDVNVPRIKKGEDPIMTLGLAMTCPIWKIIQPPFRTIELTREELFDRSINAKDRTPVIGKKIKVKGINKR